MTTLLERDLPQSLQINLSSGLFKGQPDLVQRRLSLMAPMFYDQDSVQDLLQRDDPLIYDMFHSYFETSNSDMSLAVSRIQPGKIGDEYYMTKGHFHARDDQPEIYFCLHGEGFLVMETMGGEFTAEPWTAGTVTHIPPMWAHRVVNTGKDVLFYISSFHKSAGHEYAQIERQGFSQVVVERNGNPAFIPNPRRSRL